MTSRAIAGLIGTLVLFVPKTEPQERKIPLDQCYATFPSKGMKRISSGLAEGVPWVERGEIERVIRDTHSGASNLFIVQGKDLKEVLRSTHRVVSSGVSVDQPVKDSIVAENAPLWLVAYLGRGLNPADWEIVSVSVRDKAIRVVHKKIGHVVFTDSWLFYYVWVPLPALAEGAYALELHNAASAEPYLVRRIRVGKP